jgi:hypothetical protein
MACRPYDIVSAPAKDAGELQEGYRAVEPYRSFAGKRRKGLAFRNNETRISLITTFNASTAIRSRFDETRWIPSCRTGQRTDLARHSSET